MSEIKSIVPRLRRDYAQRNLRSTAGPIKDLYDAVKKAREDYEANVHPTTKKLHPLITHVSALLIGMLGYPDDYVDGKNYLPTTCALAKVQVASYRDQLNSWKTRGSPTWNVLQVMQTAVKIWFDKHEALLTDRDNPFHGNFKDMKHLISILNEPESLDDWLEILNDLTEEFNDIGVGEADLIYLIEDPADTSEKDSDSD